MDYYWILLQLTCYECRIDESMKDTCCGSSRIEFRRDRADEGKRRVRVCACVPRMGLNRRRRRRRRLSAFAICFVIFRKIPRPITFFFKAAKSLKIKEKKTNRRSSKPLLCCLWCRLSQDILACSAFTFAHSLTTPDRVAFSFRQVSMAGHIRFRAQKLHDFYWLFVRYYIGNLRVWHRTDQKYNKFNRFTVNFSNQIGCFTL